MANTVQVHVKKIAAALKKYDQLKVYRSTEKDGIFVEITSAGNRIELNSQDTLYTYTDPTGSADSWYKTSFFDSTGTNPEGQLSAPSQASATGITQLEKNMEVVITLSKKIKATDGTSLKEDKLITFYTKFDPFHTSIRRIKLEIGSLIPNVTDRTIAILILEASLIADQINFTGTNKNSNDFFKLALKQWTTCKVISLLLSNDVFGTGGLKRKDLDNFSVSYDAEGTINNALEGALACLAKWEQQLVTGGKATQKPQMVVKGDRNLDQVAVGRLWSDVHTDGTHIPGANTRHRHFRGSRRFINGWKNMNRHHKKGGRGGTF